MTEQWLAQPHYNEMNAYRLYDDSGNPFGDDAMEMDRKARVMSAAPDLLEALQECVMGLRDGCHPMAQQARLRKARAAIAKTIGGA